MFYDDGELWFEFFDEEAEREAAHDAWEALQLEEEGRWRPTEPEELMEAEDFMPMPEAAEGGGECE